LLGWNEATVESLYLSPALAEELKAHLNGRFFGCGFLTASMICCAGCKSWDAV
jgi:hypothetical protein